jgi:hypothetical protein
MPQEVLSHYYEEKIMVISHEFSVSGRLIVETDDGIDVWFSQDGQWHIWKERN